MDWPLAKRLSEFATTPSPTGDDQILDAFLTYVQEKRLEFYPAQEEAILELIAGKNVILNTPTGSGKSLVALALHFGSVAQKRRSYYTSPIKALVNEKFLALCRDFGPERVGMITGDATVNSEAPIICCTAEILMNEALREGACANIQDVVIDEFHFYSDRERGVAWQVPLLTLPQTRFLLMSATLGDTTVFEKALTRLNGKETVVVRSQVRPVPLDFRYSEDPLHDAVGKLLREGRAPIYLVSFTQRECAEEAQNFLSVDVCTKEEKKTIAEALEGFKFTSPYGKEFQKLLRHGLGIHHAGLLPKYRVLVEKLAQRGLLKIIFGTDTLGVGVNVPLRTVLLNKICKYDGEKTGLLSVRDFQQICGRAGRKGFDDLGTVVVQAPEHVIENLRNEQKASGDAKKLKKLVKKKPPDKGFVLWTEETFKKLVGGQAEALLSRFRVTHAMILNVLCRPAVGADDIVSRYARNEEGCRALRQLIHDCHESDQTKKQLRKRAFQLFRSMVDRGIIELNPLRVNVDLQEDFSLNHALSLFLIDALKLLDPSHAEYALDALTLVESILENPDAVLRKQVDRLKTERMQELKAQGMEFDQRIEELEKIEHPKPNREFIYSRFNEFTARHPWVGEENIRPKSIAREMYLGAYSFGEYVREYELQRAEGLLLRYLSEAYKTLLQNVPDTVKNDELFAISVYFGTMIREIDSSLIDEWERMHNPENFAAKEAAAAAQAERELQLEAEDITRNVRAFTVMMRNESFRLVRALGRSDFVNALELIANVPAGSEPWTEERLRGRLTEYREAEHSTIRYDGAARSPLLTRIQADASGWDVLQILVDPEGHQDWALNLRIDRETSKQAGKPVLQLRSIGVI